MNYSSYICALSDNLKKRWMPRSLKEKVPENSSSYKQPGAEQLNVIPFQKSYSRLSSDFAQSLMAITSKILELKDLFQNIPVINGGSSYVTSRSLLSIKIRFDEIASDRDLYKSDCICLGLRLRQEGFISNPVKWLVKKGFVKNSAPCYVCKHTCLLRENLKFRDGCSWLCQNAKCRFENVFIRPRFFSNFAEFSMAHIAAMIFHWTVQSDIEIIRSDAPMDSTKIAHAWNSFQRVCSAALKQDKTRLGGENQIVEISIVKFGRHLYVLGALDRKTKRTCLMALRVNVNQQIEKFYRALCSWIVPKSYVVMDSKQQFKLPNNYNLVLGNSSITDKSSVNFHVLNITEYLQKHVSSMFGHLKPELLGQELVQTFLDELMWRERFGRYPQLAFAKIMHDIFYLEKLGLYSQLHTFGKGFLLDEPSEAKKLIEPRVVLQRIPDTVLKFYNCLPIAPKKLEPPKPVIGTPLVPANEQLHNKDEQDDELEILEVRRKEDKQPSAIIDLLDDEEEEMVDVETIHSPTHNNKTMSEKIQAEASSSMNDVIPIKKELESTSVLKQNQCSNPTVPSNKDTTIVQRDNFVPPLVIRTHKKKHSIIIMSKICETEAEVHEPDAGACDTVHASAPPKSSELKTLAKNSLEDQIKINSEERGSASSSKVLRKRSLVLRRLNDDQPKCIECGENADDFHFMKQFNCADCKTCVYSTSCSNAFFEHRGSILFGRRMPRRGKELIGIHRPLRPLLSLWYCSCGFSTRQGNYLASHLIKCQKTICYQWDTS